MNGEDTIRDYETLVIGDENHAGMRDVVTRTLKEAKENQCLVRMEVRSTPKGIPTSTVEHNMSIDPSVTNADAVMQAIVSRLNESPGEQFTGKIRINFFRSGTGDKFGTYTRNVACGLFSEAEGQPMGYQNVGSGRVPPGMPTFDEEDMPRGRREQPEEDFDPNSVEEESARMRSLAAMPPPQMSGSGSLVTDQQARAWIELYAGLNFRQQAQMIVMFERVIRFMENMAMRYDLPQPQVSGIQDAPHPTQRQPAPEGLGMIPMLLNAAAQLAASGDPKEAVQNAASMASGNPPKQGAARAMAVRGATELVRKLNEGGAPQRPPAPVRRPPPPPPDEPPPDFGGGGMEMELEQDPGTGMVPSSVGEETEMPFDAEEAVNDVASRTAELDPTKLSTDQMKETVLAWLRADPSRKAEVMNMVPELMKEVM